MPRAIWSGAISFGLVNIPIKLYSAVQRKTVRFHQLDQEDNGRIQQKRVNPRSGEEVPYENLVKGYEIGPDRYVVITPEELETLEPEKTRTIDIEDFVDLEQIDPIFYDHPYYLAPATGAQKPYKLLLDAMESAGKVAIARVVIRSKQSLVAIRARDGVLTLETMLFADEVVSPDTFDELQDEGKAKTSKKELDMAKQLIDSLSGDFDPSRYRDEYRDQVLDLIERKAQGEEITVEAEPPKPKEVPDLMAALEASIASAKSQGGTSSGDGKPETPKKKPASRARGSAKSSTKKKTAAKKS
ncbi:MAG TPA: Ku protein [Thermoleophilaceae bacterium]